MAEIAACRGIDQVSQSIAMVAWYPPDPRMRTIVTGQAIPGAESCIAVVIASAGPAHVIPRMAGLAIADTHCRRARVERVDRLRHAICGGIDRIRMTFRAGNERFVMPEVMTVEVVEIRVARCAIGQPHGHHESVVLGDSRVITAWTARFVTGLAILPAVLAAGMIPACRQPGAGAVTLVAGIAGRHMAGVLVRSDTSVVASHAIPGLCRAVVIACPEKSGCTEVAALARRIGRDMRIMLGCRHNAPPDGMATLAIPGCTLEYAAHMTGLAGSRRMRAAQLKPCSHMIKVAACGGLLFSYRMQRNHR